MKIPKVDPDKANAPYDPIVHRTTWIYRGILGILAVMCLALLIQTERLHGEVVQLQQNSVTNRADRQEFQTTQRELGCVVLKQVGGVTRYCNPDGTPAE